MDIGNSINLLAPCKLEFKQPSLCDPSLYTSYSVSIIVECYVYITEDYIYIGYYTDNPCYSIHSVFSNPALSNWALCAKTSNLTNYNFKDIQTEVHKSIGTRCRLISQAQPKRCREGYACYCWILLSPVFLHPHQAKRKSCAVIGSRTYHFYLM